MAGTGQLAFRVRVRIRRAAIMAFKQPQRGRAATIEGRHISGRPAGHAAALRPWHAA